MSFKEKSTVGQHTVAIAIPSSINAGEIGGENFNIPPIPEHEIENAIKPDVLHPVNAISDAVPLENRNASIPEHGTENATKSDAFQPVNEATDAIPLENQNAENDVISLLENAEKKEKFDILIKNLVLIREAPNGSEVEKLLKPIAKYIGQLTNEEISEILQLSFLQGLENVENSMVIVKDRALKFFNQASAIEMSCPREQSDAPAYDINLISFYEKGAEYALQEIVISQYINSLEKLPHPDPTFTSVKRGVITADIARKLDELSKVGIPCYEINGDALLQRFVATTGIVPEKFGRKIVHPAIDCPLTVYSSILVQCDLHKYLYLLEQSMEEYNRLCMMEKVAMLRLLTAVGKINSQPEVPINLGDIWQLIEIIVTEIIYSGQDPNSIDGCCGGLRAEDIRYLAKELNRPIAVICDPGEVGGPIRTEDIFPVAYFFSADGTAQEFNLQELNDTKIMHEYNQKIRGSMADENCIILYRLNDENHFSSVIKVDNFNGPAKSEPSVAQTDDKNSDNANVSLKEKI
ncbi:MAG: hypothetical protein LBI81_03395 [Puniceicoccales bacterium]|jgi:hypothetical protein|nr:hypothetical protein [Puniceicoccales bacterium]